MRLDILEAMNAARRERRAGALVTRLSDGEQRFVAAEAVEADSLAETLEATLRSGRSGLVEHAGESWFLTVLVPPVRLDASIIDPRTAFATPERFPDVPLVAQWPDEALAASPLDRYTAICLLTHDPKIDDRALVRALKADCFYIGALGSRKTHAKRIERMRAEGFGEAALARIHAPIGLDIGAVSPAEIAVSALRKKPLRAQGAAS
jgi:xanthine dehydrogenase accessory factor